MEENTMKAEDLRIGNFLDRNGLMEVVGIKVHAIKIYDHYNKIANPTWFQPEGFKGIPLTPEWLERLGFKHTQAKGFGGQDQWAGMGFISDGKVNFRGHPKRLHLEGYFNTQIEYVHQLQNLYFALTGQELTLKP